MSALVNYLNDVAVRIEDPGRVVAGVALQTGPRCFLALAPCLDRRHVERIHLGVVLRHEPHMDRLRVGLAFLQPEEGPLAVPEPLPVRVPLAAFVVGEVRDAERLQGVDVERDRPLEIADREDDVVDRVRSESIFSC
jgi:hypothetical protein